MTNLKLMDFFVLYPEKKDSSYLVPFAMDEIQALIGLLILTGVFHSNRECLSDLFSEDINKCKPIFKATMPRDRMKSMLKFLRFDDASTRVKRVLTDKLAPVRDIFERINRSFVDFYTPGTWVTVDEHLARYRGNCSFGQFMPLKPDRFGIKFWVLADARNFYPINLEVYIGRRPNFSNKPEDVVLRLASVLSPGHIIVGDNYFTSPKLSKILLSEHGIGYLGTIRKMRREVPRIYMIQKHVPCFLPNFSTLINTCFFHMLLKKEEMFFYLVLPMIPSQFQILTSKNLS